ncbi:hypothetical protein ACFWP3_08075 [Streptomyces sp. NPDC058525]|uniref:hypothetical protein n=1 Tax=Streptomyces sp. NPDC058525 TaxID=3346538 RepID=UPI00364CFFB5
MTGRRRRVRLLADPAGAGLAAVWALGHVVVGAFLVQADDTNTVAATPRPATSRPDTPPDDHHNNGGRACRWGNRATL